MTDFQPGDIVQAVERSQYVTYGNEYEVVELRPAGSQTPSTNMERIVLLGTPLPSRADVDRGTDIGHPVDLFTLVSSRTPNY